MELKVFSVRFVLAGLAVTYAHAAYADDLPPPPPPPPGVNITPLPSPSDSQVLEAPPPPPPGVVIEAPKETRTPAKLESSLPPKKAAATNLTEPPFLPPTRPGVTPTGEPTKVNGPVPPRKTPREDPRTSPNYRPGDITNSETKSTWYGWKSLMGLVPVHILFLAGASTNTEELYIGAVIGGVFITPVMHWVHGNRGRG